MAAFHTRRRCCMEAAGIAGDSQIGAEVIHAVDGTARPHPSRRQRRNRATASPTGVTTTARWWRGARSRSGSTRRCSPAGGRRAARGLRYSDAAILCRAQPARGVQADAAPDRRASSLSLKRSLGLTIEVPHYSTFCRRAGALAVPKLARPAGGGPLHLAIDATGLKVHGEGEWKVRVHGKGKRRVWRKLHLGVDTTTGEILAHALDHERDPRRDRAGRPARRGRGADRRGLRRQGLRRLRHPHARCWRAGRGR